MGNWNSSSSDENTVTVWFLNQDGAINVPLLHTLKQLRSQLDKLDNSKIKKCIYFHWTLLTQEEYDNKTLQTIISEQMAKYPHNQERNRIFIAIENQDDSSPLLQSKQTKHDKLYQKFKQIQPSQWEKKPNFSLGTSGNMLFQGRQSALLASSIHHASKNTNISEEKLIKFQKQIIQKQNQNRGFSLLGNLFRKIGLVKENHTESEEDLLQKIKETIRNSTDFSDFDPKFIYYIEEIYLKFMIKSLGKIHYIKYEYLEDFTIQNIASNSKIGIIGDFGTGLKDSLELLKNMIKNQGVNIIFHLGDVYYAGTPQQYERSITKPLNELRVSTNKQIRFYSIPGNHDYYSWGLPFLCFVKTINSHQFHKQKASYFCLRDESYKWQFLGMDTAFYDSNPLRQIDPYTIGPHVRKQEMAWHKYRLNHWQGSTILLTHHQLFSIHERINGTFTKYRNFSCLNPMLYAQIFEHLPNISASFWGHQHSMMFFKQDLFGLSKGRLIGNSSFHVMFEKQHPYQRSKGYPKIPFIVQDEQYYKKYLPINPNVKTQAFFGLGYAVIDMSKMDKENNLPIEYWCSPCYSDQQFYKMDKLSQEQRNKIYFKEYKLYEQIIYSVDYRKRMLKKVKNNDHVYLRCQIGLSMTCNQGFRQKQSGIQTNKQQNQSLAIDQNNILLQIEGKNKQNTLILDLIGTIFEIQILNQVVSQGLCKIQFSIKTFDKVTETHLHVTVSEKQQIQLHQISSNQQLKALNGIWECQSIKSASDIFPTESIFYNMPIKIYNKHLNNCLSWSAKCTKTYPCLQQKQEKTQIKEQESTQEHLRRYKAEQNTESLWMFYTENWIKQ